MQPSHCSLLVTVSSIITIQPLVSRSLVDEINLTFWLIVLICFQRIRINSKPLLMEKQHCLIFWTQPDRLNLRPCEINICVAVKALSFAIQSPIVTVSKRLPNIANSSLAYVSPKTFRWFWSPTNWIYNRNERYVPSVTRTLPVKFNTRYIA